jgi:large subunit ribosomal protein L2
MGKNLIQQRRGKGSIFKAPSFNYFGEAKHIFANESVKGIVKDLVKCPAHSTPLARVVYDNGKSNLMIAPEGLSVNDEVYVGDKTEAKNGNTMALKNIPEGISIYNIEISPGDGGKLARCSGTCARIIAKSPNEVTVELPSRKQKVFRPDCKATIGTAAGGGRVEKPFCKAGNRFYALRAKRKLYPVVAGSCMSAVAHPFGNKRSSRKSKNRPTSRNAPPGRKVGMIAARRTGRKKK